MVRTLGKTIFRIAQMQMAINMNRPRERKPIKDRSLSRLPQNSRPLLINRERCDDEHYSSSETPKELESLSTAQTCPYVNKTFT